MNAIDFTPFIISIKLSLITTALLVVVSVPVALLLAYRNFPGKLAVESVITLPMVLPPTVIGFYLLAAFSPRFAFGGFLDEAFGLRVVFSFSGIVIASCVHSFPFMVQPLRDGFSSIGENIINASYTLGKSRVSTFFRIVLPAVKPFFATGILMTFIHVMGEFGVILMIGGSIPGVTKVASIALYDSVDAGNFYAANVYAAVLILFGIAAVFLSGFLRRRKIA